MGSSIDRKKVIESLQYMISEDCTETQFDYIDDIEAAIAMLKEQESMKPTWSQGKAYCGKCGQRFPRKRADKEINYCFHCGQAVKWE